ANQWIGRRGYPTCSQRTSALLGATTSRATNTGAQKTSGQTNPRARLHQGDADLCAGCATGYSCFIPPGGPSRPWQLIPVPRTAHIEAAQRRGAGAALVRSCWVVRLTCLTSASCWHLFRRPIGLPGGRRRRRLWGLSLRLTAGHFPLAFSD